LRPRSGARARLLDQVPADRPDADAHDRADQLVRPGRNIDSGFPQRIDPTLTRYPTAVAVRSTTALASVSDTADSVLSAGVRNVAPTGTTRPATDTYFVTCRTRGATTNADPDNNRSCVVDLNHDTR